MEGFLHAKKLSKDAMIDRDTKKPRWIEPYYRGNWPRPSAEEIDKG